MTRPRDIKLPRDAAGGVLSEGRRLLREALLTNRQEDVARAAGVSRSWITRLANGWRTDSYRIRLALWENFVIPHWAWDVPPSNVQHGTWDPGTTESDHNADAA